MVTKLSSRMLEHNKRMDGKTVLITGANAGIGKEAARDLARRGARVILACRDMQRANAARDDIISSTGNANVIVQKLDLSSFASVRCCAKNIIATEERLDVLINNAGIIQQGDKKTEDGLNVGMQTNHFGPFLFTNLLVDLVKKSAPSRIIFVASVLHKAAKPDISNWNREAKLKDPLVYCYSKLANILTSNELARRLAGTGVTVNSLHPGVIYTEIWRNLPPIVRPALVLFLKTILKTVEQGARTTIYLAVSEEVEGITGEYFVACKKANMSNAARNEDLARQLWINSDDLVKVDRNVPSSEIYHKYKSQTLETYIFCQ